MANGVLPHQDVSDKIDEALKIVRNILTYKFPQDLMVIHRIQSELSGRLDITPGDFGYYAESVENMFMPSMLIALEEYGLPTQISRKMRANLEPLFELDVILSNLRIFDPHASVDLSNFEKSFVSAIQQAISACEHRKGRTILL
ncbi:hypothetical protein HFO61_24470 [Rhizobium leguminosarum]|uniref:hypothetical protein n=1 Tax=Rhizobium leguminosarum TaxID=384 RepID=UPI001C93A28A|nr:hypothetical protein [Rhizobium leguminosarum]MBY5549924.1 hypothetical protein [Rhizobium leguminosarum]